MVEFGAEEGGAGHRPRGEDTPQQAVVTVQARCNVTWSRVAVQKWSDSASMLKVEATGLGVGM